MGRNLAGSSPEAVGENPASCQQRGQFLCSVKSVSLPVCLSVCCHSVTQSVCSSVSLSVRAVQGRNERACVLVTQVRTLARPAGRCCRMKGQDQGQDQDQDRTGQDPTCRRLLAPTGYSAQNMGHQPRVHHGSPSMPPSVSQQCHSNQTITKPRQAQAAQRQ